MRRSSRSTPCWDWGRPLPLHSLRSLSAWVSGGDCPLLAAILILAVLLESLRLPLRAAATEPVGAAKMRTSIPARFWIYAAFALLYGICETMNGNWSQIDMTSHLGSSAAVASLALAAFWAMVTAGRILFAVLQRRFPARRVYHLLPFVLAGALLLIAVLPSGSSGLGVIALRAGGVRLLGAPAAHHQLQPGGAHRDLGLGRRRGDRLLPDGVRRRRLRRRATRIRWCVARHDLRPHRGGGGRDGRSVVCRRGPTTRARSPAPPTGGVTVPIPHPRSAQ